MRKLQLHREFIYNVYKLRSQLSLKMRVFLFQYDYNDDCMYCVDMEIANVD